MIEATVSTDCLLKFAKSKGAYSELSGRIFGTNLALRRLYAANGATAMKYLYNMLSWVAPKMYDYEISLGEPIAYKSDVYVPVAIDCIANDNYCSFIEVYNRTTNQIKKSIESVPVQGDTKDANLREIQRFRNYIHQMPKIWAFGFLLRDNLDNFVIPYMLNATARKYPNQAFWPKEGIKEFQLYPPHTSIDYNGSIILRANGMKPPSNLKIQKLDHYPLCSFDDDAEVKQVTPRFGVRTIDPNKNYGEKVLRHYVMQLERDYSKANDAYPYYSVDRFDNQMVIWNNGKSRVNSFEWIDKPATILGKPVCTIHFFLCYKESDITRITDIKVEPINDDSDD